MKRKIICILVCFLFFSAVFTVSGTMNLEKKPQVSIFNNFLYVGGSGPGNYSNIQESVNDAEEGDTIFVYDDSSPYFENVVIDRSIIVIGENKETTVIDAQDKGGHVVSISADGVDFSGFTVQNSVDMQGNVCAGIFVKSNNCLIHDCISQRNHYGVFLGEWSDDYKEENNVYNCIIGDNSGSGIMIVNNNRAKIYNNHIFNNDNEGVLVIGFRNTINNNLLEFNGISGVGLSNGFNYVLNNEIRYNINKGIGIHGCNFNTISRNNFIENGPDKYNHAELMGANSFWQRWESNYWNPRKHVPASSSYPYFIPYDSFWHPFLFNLDLSPAKVPYDIGE